MSNDQSVLQYTATLHDFERVTTNIQNIQAVNFSTTERTALVTVRLAHQASFAHDLVSHDDEDCSQDNSESVH